MKLGRKVLMKSKSALPFLLLVMLGATARAQLPDSFDGWETKSFRPITAANLSNFAGDDAAVVGEYGYLGGEHREYAKGDAGLHVNLWRMKDSSGSFGLFTFYREIGTASLEEQDRIAIWPSRLLMQHGPYVVDAQGAKLTLGAAKLLLSKIPPIRRDESLLPDIPGYFPEANLIPQSPKYITGAVTFERLEKSVPAAEIGFNQGAEAAIAQYRMGGATVRMLLVSYPTPQAAVKKLRSFQALPGVAGGNEGNGIFVQRKGSLVGFVFDAPASVANNLFDNIRYEREITWSQRVPTRRDNIGELVINVFLLAGFVLLFAVVAGLSLGGFRVLAAKFMPNAIFDRPSQMEIIQLHLTDQ